MRIVEWCAYVVCTVMFCTIAAVIFILCDAYSNPLLCCSPNQRQLLIQLMARNEAAYTSIMPLDHSSRSHDAVQRLDHRSVTLAIRSHQRKNERFTYQYQSSTSHQPPRMFMCGNGLQLIDSGCTTIVLCCGGMWRGLLPTHSRIHDGLSELFGGWYESMKALYWSYHLNLPFAMIGFNTLSEVATLNCGQQDDVAHLHETILYLLERFPRANIIILSECLSSLRVMNWITHAWDANKGNPYSLTLQQRQRLCGIILESPVESLQHAIHHLVPQAWIGEPLYRFISKALCNYNHQDCRYWSFTNRLHKLSIDVPVLVATIHNDLMCTPEHARTMFAPIKHAQYYVCTSANLRHGELCRDPDYQTRIRTFLQECVSKR